MTEREVHVQESDGESAMEDYLTWTIWACPECGRDRGPVAQYIYRRCQCGSHCPQREVEVVPAEQLRGAVDALRKIDALLEADINRGAFMVRLEQITADALSLYGGR